MAKESESPKKGVKIPAISSKRASVQQIATDMLMDKEEIKRTIKETKSPQKRRHDSKEKLKNDEILIKAEVAGLSQKIKLLEMLE